MSRARLTVQAVGELLPGAGESGELRLDPGDHIRDRLVGRPVLYCVFEIVVRGLDGVCVGGLDVLRIVDHLVPRLVDVVEGAADLILGGVQADALQRDDRSCEIVEARAQILRRFLCGFLVAAAGGKACAEREREERERQRALHTTTTVRATTPAVSRPVRGRRRT